MSIRINWCVDSFSATPVSMSAADDHHRHENSRCPPLVTSSNSRWRHFTSNLNETTSPRFRIIRGSKSYVLVDKMWVFNVQSLIFSQIITNHFTSCYFCIYCLAPYNNQPSGGE
jgi:hypothetical protein